MQQPNQTTVIPPHVFIFPLPLQGPVNCMLKLAELLCLQQIQVTFLNTQHIQHRLKTYTHAENYFQKYQNFRFRTVPDGLSEDNPRTGDQILNLLRSLDVVAVPIFREMVSSGEYGPQSEMPVSCIIADGIFTFAVAVAKEIGVPLLYFDTISPCGLWTYLCVPKLIQAGELPFKELKYCPGPPIPRVGSCEVATTNDDCPDLVLEHFSMRAMARCTGCVNVGKDKSECTSEVLCDIPPK